jgi:CheY-like chemotaxis protein
LLVDDEEPLLRLMTDTLSELGYLPVGFTSSVEALAAFEAHPDRFDAVITDERMPRLSGATLIRAVRKSRPTIPVLLVSGYLGEEVVGRARQAGADAVLRKPLSTPALANSLARAIRSCGSERAVARQPVPARARRPRKAVAPRT